MRRYPVTVSRPRRRFEYRLQPLPASARSAPEEKVRKPSEIAELHVGGDLARDLQPQYEHDLCDISTEHESPEIFGDICTYDFEREGMYQYVVMSENPIKANIYERADAMAMQDEVASLVASSIKGWLPPTLDADSEYSTSATGL